MIEWIYLSMHIIGFLLGFWCTVMMAFETFCKIATIITNAILGAGYHLKVSLWYHHLATIGWLLFILPWLIR